MEEDRILFFVRLPEPGRVKTRLAASVGDEAAAELYGCFAGDMLETLRSAQAPLTCVAAPPERAGEVRAWLGCRECVPQEGPDLGARMKNAFEQAFARGARRVVLVGSDLPDLPVGHVERAFGLLESHGAVLGPAEDGGYYLIGFTREGFVPEAFVGPDWGGDTVYAKTLGILRARGVEPGLAPAWRDVDTAADLVRLVCRVVTGKSGAARTIERVRELRL